MADDKTKTRPRDARRINLDEPYEIQNWCKSLGLSEQELRDAVAKVGTSAEAVKKHLGK
jgi:hypothetical protein